MMANSLPFATGYIAIFGESHGKTLQVLSRSRGRAVSSSCNLFTCHQSMSSNNFLNWSRIASIVNTETISSQTRDLTLMRVLCWRKCFSSLLDTPNSSEWSLYSYVLLSHLISSHRDHQGLVNSFITISAAYLNIFQLS